MALSVFEHCKAKGISILELADKSGLDVPKTRAMYLGRWTPSPAERQQIAAALQVPVDEVAWGHDTPIQHLYGHGET